MSEKELYGISTKRSDAMSSDMTPRTTTPKQINKAVSNYRALLESRGVNFPVDALQIALGNPALATAQFELLRNYVEMSSGVVIRDFTVDLSLVGMVAIDATGRTKYVDDKVVAAMPRAMKQGGQIHFFQAGRYVPVGEVDGEYTKRGLVAVDPHSLAAFNTTNPTFADDHPNGTQWLDANGKVCYASFNRWHGRRFVGVVQCDRVWNAFWWLAGVKPSELTT